ncbi:MAG: hypothetical protein WD638_13115 [Nitriliruptoraceae bacterium]
MHVRIRTLFTFSVGVAAGAGAMYLFDPEHGEERRRQARRDAAQRARHGAARATTEAKHLVRDVTGSAIEGFKEARAEDGPNLG